MMRKLLYVLLAMLLLGKPEAASACQLENPQSDEQLYAKASTVFVGRILRTEEVEGRPEFRGAVGSRPVPLMEATLRLVEVLKGDPPADRKVRGWIDPSNCDTLLLVGFEYVIFLNEGSNFVVSEMGAGTRALSEWRVEDTYCQGRRCVLEKFRALGKKAQ